MKRFFAGLVALALVSGGLGPAKAGNVLLLSTSVAAEDNAVVNLLEAQGQSVTIGPYYGTYSGSNLSGYSAVILLQNNNGDGENIPAAGQTAIGELRQRRGWALDRRMVDSGTPGQRAGTRSCKPPFRSFRSLLPTSTLTVRSLILRRLPMRSSTVVYPRHSPLPPTITEARRLISNPGQARRCTTAATTAVPLPAMA